MTLVLLLYQNLTPKKARNLHINIYYESQNSPPKVTGKISPTAHTRIHHNQAAFITKKARLTQHLKIN